MILEKRWGDAPVHSIGASLFAKKEQIVSPVIGLQWAELILISALFQRHWSVLYDSLYSF